MFCFADIFGFGELLREQDYKNYNKYGVNLDNGFAKSEIYVDFKRGGLRKAVFNKIVEECFFKVCKIIK